MLLLEPVSAAEASDLGLEATQSNSELDRMKSLVQELSQQVYLHKVVVSTWTGRRRSNSLRVLSEGSSQQEMDSDTVTKPQYRLRPPEWDKRINSAIYAVQNSVAKFGVKVRAYGKVIDAAGAVQTVETVLDDANVIPRAREAEADAAFETAIKEHWVPTVVAFVDAWPSVVEWFRKTQSPPIFEEMSQHFPASQDALRACFRVIPIKRSIGLSVDELTLESIRKGSASYIQAIAESVVREPIAALNSHVDTLLERIRTKGVLRGANLQNVRDAIQAVAAFGELSTDEAMKEKLRAADEVLAGYGDIEEAVKVLNADNRNGAQAASNQLAAVLTSLRNVSDADAVAENRLGRNRRAVSI